MKKVLGLILELNPFHNGHVFFIQEAKRKVDPDITIAVVTTNFSMRGDIQVIDKFQKTKMLLQKEIDIVLELPFLGSVASADYFAYNSIKTLTDMKITDLAFGAETTSLDELNLFKKIIKSNEYNSLIKENMNKGFSYGTSSVKAIQTITGDIKKAEMFSLPNNTLAIQYLNALDIFNKDINVTLIKRIANNYYDEEINSSIASATSLRNALSKYESIDDFVPNDFNTSYIDINKSQDNLYKLLQYKIYLTPKDELTNILGINEGIENRLISFINQDNYSSFIESVETKRYTKSFIKRLILHILLNVNKSYSPQYYNYLRVLGMNSLGKSFISKLDKDTKKSIITTFKNHEENEIVKFELLSTKLYGIITNKKDFYLEEYKIPIILGEEK